VNTIAELTGHADRSLLIVEDDKPFLERLSRAMETRGFTVTSCDSVSDGLAQIGRAAPACRLIASGGAGELSHLRSLASAGLQTLAGAIAGTALYERKFSLREGQAALEGSC